MAEQPVVVAELIVVIVLKLMVKVHLNIVVVVELVVFKRLPPWCRPWGVASR